ncbi:MAG: YbaK/EbsC family protein [Candidatus Nanohaloarchaea archaeon]
MKADDFLDEQGIEYTVVHQDNPTKTCDDAAMERGLETSQIVKSLIVRRGEEYFHALVPGDRTLSEKKFGEHRMAEPEKSREITDQESGTVHPFSSELKHFVDERLFEEDTLSFTTGDILKGVVIGSSEFEEGLEAASFEFETGDYVVSEKEDLEELEEKGLDSQDAKFVADKGLRTVFNQLYEEHDADEIINTFKKLRREELEVDAELCEELIERSENETHMQKLAEEYAETGEFPDDTEFELESVVENAVDQNPKAVEDFNSGKDSAINYLLGQVMQQTQGKADGERTRELLEAELDDRS